MEPVCEKSAEVKGLVGEYIYQGPSTFIYSIKGIEKGKYDVQLKSVDLGLVVQKSRITTCVIDDKVMADSISYFTYTSKPDQPVKEPDEITFEIEKRGQNWRFK